jgi:hypothetical protein
MPVIISPPEISANDHSTPPARADNEGFFGTSFPVATPALAGEDQRSVVPLPDAGGFHPLGRLAACLYASSSTLSVLRICTDESVH